MADVSYSIASRGQGKTETYLKKYFTLEITSISNADTVTVGELTTVNAAKVIDLADGTEYSVTLATNVITIDDVGCSSDHVVILAVGV